MEAPTDEKLIKEYLEGKSASFELLVRRHVQELYQFVMRFTGNAVAAEDVVQETLLQVHSSAASFDPHRRFKPWLFTIAANKARDYIRKRHRRRELPFDAHVDPDSDASQRFIDLLASDAPPPDEDLHWDEKRRAVKRAVEAMPTRLREALILAYFHRLSYKDIAEIVGVPLGTIKSRLHAAVASFKECYEAAAQEQTNHEP